MSALEEYFRQGTRPCSAQIPSTEAASCPWLAGNSGADGLVEITVLSLAGLAMTLILIAQNMGLEALLLMLSAVAG